MNYRKSDTKDWARQNWHGLCNVIIPSYCSGLKRLNALTKPPGALFFSEPSPSSYAEPVGPIDIRQPPIGGEPSPYLCQYHS